MGASAAHAGNSVTLGCFEVGGRVYAIDVAQLREVVRWQPVTPLPNAPKLIEGVIDLRFAVEAALEVISVPVERMGDPPALATQTGYDAARAVVRRPQGVPIVVLSLDHLLERVYRSALPAREEPAAQEDAE